MVSSYSYFAWIKLPDETIATGNEFMIGSRMRSGYWTNGFHIRVGTAEKPGHIYVKMYDDQGVMHDRFSGDPVVSRNVWTHVGVTHDVTTGIYNIQAFFVSELRATFLPLLSCSQIRVHNIFHHPFYAFVCLRGVSKISSRGGLRLFLLSTYHVFISRNNQNVPQREFN